MTKEQHLYTNRLIREKSPYLLQHAHNPVDWYPWGDEAFFAAREKDKPIFLSIGYATCHWCHVMEKESFENLEVAQAMNQTFINIKVDREELPEVDSLYMEFAQSMMTGAAGWPLNVIITPDLFPFFATTYLPPTGQRGLMGLTDLVLRINEIWENEDEREQISQQSIKVVEVFSQNVHTTGEQIPGREQVDDAAELLFKMGDSVYGGMKGAPKFPIGYQSNFILRYSKTTQDSRAIFLVDKTLDMMQRGGIYDHLGGGFSRYSVDEKWLVPHFEKMLYDNAFLANCYQEAWQTTKRELYQETCEETLNYILRDMTFSEGGFYSAEDADSEGHEGYFYTWSFDEIQALLGNQHSFLFCEFYGITPEGNFEGRNILHIRWRLEEFAKKIQLNPMELASRFITQKQILWKVREERVRPIKDDKILSSWNGLMIFSMAEAGNAFNEKRYLNAALKAARFIKERLWKNERLLRRWREDEALYSAGLEDYAFLIRGVLSLFESDLGKEWLEWAIEMTAILCDYFKAPGGAFFQTDGLDSNIILRKCQFSDGAEPSGNSVHCENLLRLYQLTGEPAYLHQAEDILKAVKKYIDNYPPGYSYHMMNLNRYYDKHAPTIVVALNEKEQFYQEIRDLIYHHFIPHKALIWRRNDDEKLFSLIPFAKTQTPIDGKTTLYICFDGACQNPITDFQQMIEAIQRL